MGDSGSSLLLLLVLAVNLVMISSRLTASYPVEGNYSLVHLSCTDNFNERFRQPVSFRVNDSLTKADTALVTITQNGGYYTDFTFTQSQEGVINVRDGGELVSGRG